MTTFDAAYAERTTATKALYERARRTIPGGAGSTARLPRNGWKPYPSSLPRVGARACATWTATSTSTTYSASDR